MIYFFPTFKQGQIVIRIKLPETQKEDKNHYEKSITERASPSVKDCKKMLTFNEKFKGCFSHLSNKREVALTDFEKFHLPRLLISPCLLELCTSLSKKSHPPHFFPTSMLSDLTTFTPPPCLLER